MLVSGFYVLTLTLSPDTRSSGEYKTKRRTRHPSLVETRLTMGPCHEGFEVLVF